MPPFETISLTRLRDEGDLGHGPELRRLAAAVRTTGFFYLARSGVDPDLVASSFQHAKAFFDLPLAAKSSYAVDRTNRGYDGIEGQRFDPAAPADAKESFRLTREPADAVPRGRPWDLLVNQPNKWPVELPSFRPHFLSFLSACEGVVLDLLIGIERALALPPDSLSVHHRRRNYTLRLIHYPHAPSGLQPGQSRCGAHTDWGTLTLLFQDEVGGLEVQVPDGSWIEASPVPRTAIVNVGDMLAAHLGRRVTSSRHRVPFSREAAGRDRYSIALFAYADFDAPLDGLDASTSGAYIMSKLAATQTPGVLGERISPA